MRSWDAWSELAGREWRHELAVPNAELLADQNSLEEPSEGVYRWVEESVWRTGTGVYLFLRRERQEQGPEGLTVIVGEDPATLVTAIRGRLGMPPGRIEVLGRGGIEIGLEPDNEIEGDELEGPIPD